MRIHTLFRELKNMKTPGDRPSCPYPLIQPVAISATTSQIQLAAQCCWTSGKSPSSVGTIATEKTLAGAGLYLLCIFSGQGDCFPSFLLSQFEFNHKISSPRPMKFYIDAQTIC